MSQSFQFQSGKLVGEMKPAESTDNPGELMIISMPLKLNVPDMTPSGAKLVECPLCGKSCWARPQIADAAKMFTGRAIAACTDCAVRAGLNKGEVPRMLAAQGKSSDAVLEQILNQLK